MRRLAAEMLGTFCLVFAGTGAIIVNDEFGKAVTHVGIALTFGLVVLALICALGDVSGCHINPAVTLGFWATRRFNGRWVGAYIAAQCAGACLASALLRALFPTHPTLGATLPAGGVFRVWIFEFFLTFMLMAVILGVSTGSREKGAFAGVAIGAVIGLEALFAGPVTGASMNPARSLAPALLSLRLEHLWIYLTAPVLGALAAVVVCSPIYRPSDSPASGKATA
jgi:aquaporin Z